MPFESIPRYFSYVAELTLKYSKEYSRSGEKIISPVLIFTYCIFPATVIFATLLVKIAGFSAFSKLFRKLPFSDKNKI